MFHFGAAITKSLKPSDTHCGHGEQCISSKYCPKDTPYVGGVCGSLERHNPEHDKYTQFNREYKAEQRSSTNNVSADRLREYKAAQRNYTDSSSGDYRSDHQRSLDRNGRR